MPMPRVVHFEIHADDTARAMKFYAALFQWTFMPWGEEDYWFVRTADDDKMAGINGAIMKRKGPAPIDGAAVNGFVNTIDVPNLDNSMSQIEPAGGTIVVPRMPIPSVGWLCYCKDSEGNIFGMMQNDPEAK